jgi:hypothetical protein
VQFDYIQWFECKLPISQDHKNSDDFPIVPVCNNIYFYYVSYDYNIYWNTVIRFALVERLFKICNIFDDLTNPRVLFIGRSRLGLRGYGTGQTISMDIHGCFHHGYYFDSVRGSGTLWRHKANRSGPVVHC